MAHQRFRFRSLDKLDETCERLGVSLPLASDLAPLARSVRIGRGEAPNSMAVHPMEGCDGTSDGRPDDLTRRRYRRFAAGGCGLLWFEATAVVPEGRANPRQLLMAPTTEPAMREMLVSSLAAARASMGEDWRPYTVLQLTHSGRYSRPEGWPAPLLIQHDPLLDGPVGASPKAPVVSDAYLDSLIDTYVGAARLAQRCGFDAVDIKACHRYLISELLAAHTREGRYGGTLENRTRLLLDIVRAIRREVPSLDVAVRLNVYDGHPYPWGWGVDRDDAQVPDLSEPLWLVSALRDAGVALLNVTAGNPYYTPHINRPFDDNVEDGYVPDEHPLVGVGRLVELARGVKERVPDLVVVGTGYSWLRQYAANAMAGVLERGWADIVGVGRGAFAYPNWARDVLERGALDRRRVCIACSRCTQIMRDGGRAGCAIRDREVYGPIYDAGRRRSGR
ncbi:MAG: NADH:flavin oxidoreductase [Anaerolineae bacterium]